MFMYCFKIYLKVVNGINFFTLNFIIYLSIFCITIYKFMNVTKQYILKKKKMIRKMIMKNLQSLTTKL